MNVTKFAVCVFALALISVIGELILPEGRTKKAAKVVFSLALTLSVVSPVTSILGKTSGLNIESVVDLGIDEDFILYVDGIAETSFGRVAESALLNSGVEGVLTVDCMVDDSTKKLFQVTVFYDKNVISEEDEHTYITEIKNIVSAACGIDKEDVLVSGG